MKKVLLLLVLVSILLVSCQTGLVGQASATTKTQQKPAFLLHVEEPSYNGDLQTSYDAVIAQQPVMETKDSAPQCIAENEDSCVMNTNGQVFQIQQAYRWSLNQ